MPQSRQRSGGSIRDAKASAWLWTQIRETELRAGRLVRAFLASMLLPSTLWIT
jgi:hypothetical protein